MRRQIEMANQQQQQAVASERTRERESSRQQEADNKETSTVDKWLQGVAKGGWVEGKSKSYKNCSTLSRVAKSWQRAAEMTGGYK